MPPEPVDGFEEFPKYHFLKTKFYYLSASKATPIISYSAKPPENQADVLYDQNFHYGNFSITSISPNPPSKLPK